MFRVTTGCGFESLAVQLKITNCLSNETLNRGPVSRRYTPSTLKNQAEFSVVLTGRLAQQVERRTREHNVTTGCGFDSPAGQLKITN